MSTSRKSSGALRRALLGAALVGLGSVGSAQFLAEQAAVAGIQGELSSQQVAGGQVALDRARAVANPNAPNPGLAGLGGPAVAPDGQPGGVPGQTPTPTPIPTMSVLEGRRIFDAVTGALIEDAQTRTALVTDKERYFDDGVRDNGIPNDGIMGNVETIRDKLIGADTAASMFQTINLIRNAERLTTLEFFRLRVGVTDPAEADSRMPDLIAMEKKKDELLRDWNNRFLAVYRTSRTDPKSDFYQVYVPEPPAIPQFPIPAGYQSPQRLAVGEAAPQAQQQAQPERTPNILNGESHFSQEWVGAQPAQPAADGK